ncbi:hypothetical protein R1sor_009682 [Riccia sorocarpa]|uniref:Uncharacterized protein n=1 Tax=Riccia sorocarpa TaxID=122646 RepID=A0ABD3HZX0_9MARC
MGRGTMRRSIGSFMGNALGGVRGRENAAAWMVAFTAAYLLWIKPARDAQKEEEARAILRREADLHRYVEKTRPIADPQERGLIRGKGKQSVSES